MADGAEGEDGNEGGGNEIVRPDALPEAYWDPEAKAPKYEDLGKDLGELPTLRELKAKHDERAAKIPADGRYKIDLPADFKIPAGQKWSVPPEIADGLSTLAKERGWTQDDVTAIAAFKAKMDLDGDKAAQDFYTAETKALGDKAEARRGAVKTWLNSKDASGLTKDQAEALMPMLGYRHGVEALEALQKLAAGVRAQGLPASGAEKDNSELVDNIGKPGAGRRLLDAANAPKH